MKKTFENHGISLSEKNAEQLERYMEMLLSWNEKVNLTAIVDPDQIWVKHFLDSAMLGKFEELRGKKVIDIGTGAGLPGLVLKIMDAESDVTLLDSLAKRIAFLDEVVEQLSLENAYTYHARAEDGAHLEDLRESFDIATSRAVARLNMLCEYCLPYVKVGGVFVAYKGREYDEELKEAERAIEIFGAKLDRVEEFKLDSDNTRALIFIRKLSQTPLNYPRKPHVITKKPIM